ncbi:Uncharacterised protein [Moraxella lacunata]|uniref:Uncharacterized protein n=1 Tax=Moraxella lacunata TaxID=477 RepID=A0A378TUF5_MORLA|nr:hypothetical protein [Moraxella lacunata]STZ63333.1 Uncharacterised protein [Moraxella lacunata]
MSNKINKIKIFFLFIKILFIIAIILYFVIMHDKEKDLVKKGLLVDATIQKNDIVFNVKKDYASGLIIRDNNISIYDKNLGYEISNIIIENYPSAIHDKKIYHFMLYQYELGGHGFSGFDFCINNKKVFYGKNIKNCLKDDGLD